MLRRHKDEDKETPRKVEIETEDETASDETAATEQTDSDQLDIDIAALQDELDQLRKDAEESRDHYLRILAEFDNFRKRQREDGSRMASLAREDIILKLLPIIDNFERALQSADAQHSFESLVEGVQLTLRQITDMLKQQGVEPIEAVGEQFNPELHEAMMRVDSDEYPENTVVDEFEKGYTINGKVLRPSRVRVAASPPNEVS